MRTLCLPMTVGCLILFPVLGGCALFQPVTEATPRPFQPELSARPMDYPSQQTADADNAAPDDITAWARQAGDAPSRRGGDPGETSDRQRFVDPIQDMLDNPPADGVLAVPPAYLRALEAERRGLHHQDLDQGNRDEVLVGGRESDGIPPQESGGPPSVLSVNVAPQRAPSTARPGAAAPGINQGASQETLRSLRELVAAMPDGESGSLSEAVDRRLLAALAGDVERARSPLPGVDTGTQRIVNNMIDLVLTLRENPDPGRLDQARDTLDSLRTALREAGDLEIPAFVLCARVDGFGRYTEMSPAEFPTGARNAFVAYCELKHFTSRREPDGYFRSEFSLRIEVLNRLGERVHEFKADNIVDRCRSPRTDCFIAPLVELPAGLAPGDYVVKLTMIDRIGQKVAQQRTSMRIVAR